MTEGRVRSRWGDALLVVLVATTASYAFVELFTGRSLLSSEMPCPSEFSAAQCSALDQMHQPIFEIGHFLFRLILLGYLVGLCLCAILFGIQRLQATSGEDGDTT